MSLIVGSVEKDRTIFTKTDVVQGQGQGFRVKINFLNIFPNFLFVIEKKGLYQVTGILENYGIDSETDMSFLDRDDFSKSSSNGLKSMEGKNLE